MHEFTYNKSFPFHQIEIVEETTEKIYCFDFREI